MNLTRIGFICGLPRSGTTWLARTLATHPNIAVFGETDFWGRDYIYPESDGTYSRHQIERIAKIQSEKEWQKTTGDDQDIPGLSSGDYTHVVEELFTRSANFDRKETPKNLFYKLASGVATAQDKTFVLEKTPGHLLFIERLRENYPQAPIIILFREPYGFVASLMHHTSRPSLNVPPWLKRFAYHPALTVFWWRAYARRLIVQLQNKNDTILLIDHHQLTTDPRSVLRLAAAYVGIDPDQLTVDLTPTNSSFSTAPRRSAPLATGHWLRLLAPQELLRLYPNHRADTANRLAIVTSWLLLLPSLLLFIAVFLPRSSRLIKYLSGSISPDGSASL